MDIREATRKTFSVKYVQVDLQNINDVAEWTKGTVVQVPTKMMGTETLLPAIEIEGQGVNRGQKFTALLGSFVVELNGSFRVYKPLQFDATFEDKGSLDEAEAPEDDCETVELPEDSSMRAAI